MTAETLTVLFADLADSTVLYQNEGDVEAHLLVSTSLQCMKAVVERHGGTLLRTVGDAVLASFHSADAACTAAVDIQKEHQLLKLSVRIGFHFGEVIPDAGDLYGNAVNIAARVAAFAEADEICTTEDAVLQLSDDRLSSAHMLDRVEFKGISKPMAVYRIQWAGDNEDTLIVGDKSWTDRYRPNRVLELIIGARHLRVDAINSALTFGRADDNDVVIDADSVSRNHAKIEFVRGRFLLHDSSTNGTYLARSGLKPEFFRRESVSLDNFGSIGLGFSPETNKEASIQYRTTTPG